VTIILLLGLSNQAYLFTINYFIYSLVSRMTPRLQHVPINSAAFIHCRVRYWPQIKWLHNNKSIPNENAYFTKFTIIIPRVTKKEEGNYTCYRKTGKYFQFAGSSILL